MPHPNRLTALLVGFLVGAMLPARLAAQFTAPPPPAAYALQHATVVRADGTELANVTLVVRGGLIEAIGPDVPVPEDAMLLEGDSLRVYPGFIDAQGKADYEFPEEEVDRSQIESWAPPRSVQSFTPHRRVVDHLTAIGTDLASARRQGVVAAAVHPDGRLMPGRGALLLFRPSAGSPTEMVVQPALGPMMSFRGAQGVYPSQHFGVLAFMRQTFEDVRYVQVVETAYQRDPRGMTAPNWDPDFLVLRDGLSGNVPVFFAADGVEDIRQVLELADAYGFRPVILGGDEAWKLADVLRDKNVPVLVSLDFPKPTRWDPKKDTVEADLDPAVLREKERLEHIYANAGRLAAAGVTFALTSGGTGGDLRTGARTAIEHGLAGDAALRALTATPAALLGVPQFVRAEPGFPANLVITDTGLFEEDADIMYTFVEGSLERGKRPTGGDAGGDADAAPANIGGEWQLESSIMDQTRRGRMTIRQTGDTFTGTTTVEEGTLRIESGSVSGNRVTFVIQFDAGGQMIEIRYSGTVDGDVITGEMTMEFGSGTWTATRTPGEGA